MNLLAKINEAGGRKETRKFSARLLRRVEMEQIAP